MFTANDKMKFPSRQKTEKSDSVKLLSYLLTRDTWNNFSKEWDKLKNVNFHAFVTRSCLLFAVCRFP